MIVEDQSEVISFLSTPGTLGAGATPARVETHASVVFLTEENAYKLKRSVRFPFLDYSTVDRRHRFCEAEVAVNRRTAPDLYEGVLAVTRAPDGGLELDGDGEAVDWLVVMHRFDEDTQFDRLAQKGALDRFAMEDLADAIARFHAAADVRPKAGGRAGLEEIIENNAKSFEECPPGVLDAATVEGLNKRPARRWRVSPRCWTPAATPAGSATATAICIFATSSSTAGGRPCSMPSSSATSSPTSTSSTISRS